MCSRTYARTHHTYVGCERDMQIFACARIVLIIRAHGARPFYLEVIIECGIVRHTRVRMLVSLCATPSVSGVSGRTRARVLLLADRSMNKGM